MAGPLRAALLALLCLLLLSPLVSGVSRSWFSFRRPAQVDLPSWVSRRMLAANLAQPNYTLYHRKEDLLRKVSDIVKANPSFMREEVLSAKDGDYAAEVKVVTVEPWGFTDRKDKAHLLMDFGEHGREYISSELGLLLMQTLQKPEALLNVFGDGDVERGKRLQKLMAGTVIKILPMENEGGRRLVESGRLCERKNGRGVDPNRNWPIDWGTKEPDYDPNEEYPGTAPFSEPEVKLLSGLAKDFAPHVWLNVHSGMEAMFTPWDHIAEVPPAAKEALNILLQIHKDLMAGTTCAVGSGGKTVGYLAHGTATDYMFEVLKVPMSYTWEIYGDFQAHFDDCFRMFNPLDEKGVNDVLTRWLRAIFRLVELMPSHPAMANSTAWSEPAPAVQPAGKPAATATPQPAASQDGQQQAAPVKKEDGKAGEGTASAQGSGQAQGHTQAQQQGTDASRTTTPDTTPKPSTAGAQPAKASSQAQGGASGTGAGSKPGATTGATKTGEASSKTQSTQSGATGTPGAEAAGPNESGPQVTVVASQLGFGGSWATSFVVGAAAVAGIVVVGVLAYRCTRGTRGYDRIGARRSGGSPV